MMPQAAQHHDLTPHIRPVLRHTVRATDPDAVRRIVASTNFFRPDEIVIAGELVDERLIKGESSGYYFVFAELDNSVVGYACYGPIPCTLGSYDLYWIAVSKDIQAKGVGSALMRYVEHDVLKRNGRLLLIETTSMPHSELTRKFYRKQGYAIAGTIKDFYADGDDKVIYRKRLQGPGE